MVAYSEAWQAVQQAEDEDDVPADDPAVALVVEYQAERLRERKRTCSAVESTQGPSG